MFQVSPFVQSERVTLQDESQEVEELQLAVLHVLLDVFAHQGPEKKRNKKSHTHARYRHPCRALTAGSCAITGRRR